ncbi:MAG: GNAT family N-acetyltransferase [Actinobacteria bacterium]|nr:GNAT family N-acetyltransferase [Actinomycetota bacterium]
MIQYRRALASEVQHEVVRLARKSFQEVDPRIKNAFDIEVNIDLYKAMESGGNHAVFVAEEGDQVLGYLSMTMNESPHIIGYWQAIVDSVYVDTEHRKAKIAINLIRQAEQYAKELGCSSMTIGFKAKNPHERFAKSIGFEPDDVMYTKLLEGVE